MKTALVTGAGGFIGSHLTQLLAEQGWQIRALAHYHAGGSAGCLDQLNPELRPYVTVTWGDVTDYRLIRELAQGADAVFHLAALIGVPHSHADPHPFVQTNVNGTLNVLQAALDTGVRRLVHVSAGEIYGTAQTETTPETEPPNPHSPYAATKAAADLMALSYHRTFNLPVTIVRPFNTYGPRQSARAIVPTIMGQIAAGQKEIRLGSITPTRDMNFVSDTVRGLLAAATAENCAGEIINLGTGKEISIGDLAELIAEIMGADIRIICDEKRIRPEKSEVERLCADASKAEKLLGWKPEYSLRHGLELTADWVKDHAAAYAPGHYAG